MVKKKKKVSKKPARPTKKKAKKVIKKTVSKGKRGLKAVKRPKTPEMMLEQVGEVTHYFGHVSAAAVKLVKSGMAVGDKIYIKGHTTDFSAKVKSMQLDHEPIIQGKKGQEIGLSVKSRVRIGDKVYKV